MKENKEQNIEPKESILASLKKENKLLVPTDYFEQLPKQLLEISEQENQKPTKVVVRLLFSLTAIAAMIVLGLFVLKPLNHQNSEIALFNITFNNLTADGFSESMLIEDDYLQTETNFDDAEVLHFFKKEMQKPHLEIEVTESDFEDYFELEEDY